jgi:hypothetical protein
LSKDASTCSEYSWLVDRGTSTFRRTSGFKIKA